MPLMTPTKNMTDEDMQAVYDVSEPYFMAILDKITALFETNDDMVYVHGLEAHLATWYTENIGLFSNDTAKQKVMVWRVFLLRALHLYHIGASDIAEGTVLFQPIKEFRLREHTEYFMSDILPKG